MSLQDGTLALGRKALFEKAAFGIYPGDRIGLVGPNGSGKTSLLRVLAGGLALDSGMLSSRQGLRVAYLAQHITFEDTSTLLDFMRARAPGREALEREAQQLEQALSGLNEFASHQKDALDMAARLAELHQALADFDQHFADHVALRLLSGLGFAPLDAQRPLQEFSGGWKMRALLAALLFTKPDLLLLDEPTNHLDLPTSAWFSNYLKSFPSAFVLISHDREFLNEQVSRIVSFEPEGVRTYQGNYDAYLRQRQEEATVLVNRHRNLEKQKEKTEAFIQRFRAKANKAKAVQSRVRALEKMESVEVHQTHREINFSFARPSNTSKEVLRVEGLGKSYGAHEVLKDIHLTANRGDKIAIIGVNGAGKTTLLKTLAGETEQNAGTISLGQHVSIGYYAQHHSETLDPTLSVLEAVSQNAVDTPMTQVRTILGGLLFGNDEIDKPIRVLSGGERARIALARLLLSRASLLLMDEPTNHLDLQSSERLARGLHEFPGTVLFVSHHRHFIRQVATKIWNVHDGTVEVYPGTLDEYMDSAIRQLGGTQPTAAPPKAKSTSARVTSKELKRRRAQLQDERRRTLKPLQQQVDSLEETIEQLEQLQKARGEQLADPAVYNASPETADLLKSYQGDAQRLEELHAEWESAVLALEKAGNRFDERESALDAH